MKLIPVGTRCSALVDEEDFEIVSKYKWSISGYGYARAAKYDTGILDKNGHIKQRVIKMHRLIMNAPTGISVDHINGNPLDNRRKNLRLCTMSQNLSNRPRQKNNTSGYKGVYSHQGKWVAEVKCKGKKFYLGIFDDKNSAALAYNVAAKKYHREFAVLNEIK